MHWTIEYMLCLVQERKISLRELERKAGVATNITNRWKKERRAPHITTLDKALNVLGYRIAIVPLENTGDLSDMNRDKLMIAVAEARRFIARAEALPPLLPYKHHITGCELVNDHYPKEQGAIKRASMDLTRALADFRKG